MWGCMGDYTGLNLTVVEARCDWITATAHNNDRGRALFDFGMDRVEDEGTLGSKISTYNMRGYRGMQSRHVRTGWGPEGAILVLSGDEAAICAAAVARIGEHFSRVDLCVTIRAGEGQINPPSDYISTKAKLKERPNGHPQLSRYQELWGGDCFYIGKRISPYYCRCYDKTAESHGDYPPQCWRWEVEMKRHASEGLHKHAAAYTLTPSYVAARVAYEFTNIGLSVPWRVDMNVSRDPQIRHRPDADRKLEWLEAAVRPSVDFVREARGDDSVLRALDLPHVYYVQPTSPTSAEKGG